MRNKIWQKSILILIPVLLVLSLVNLVGAGSDDRSENDRAITSKVMDKFQSDSQLMGSGINVDTKDGEVTLKGMVKSQADVTRAGQLAGYVDGVRKVDNRLKTERASSSGSIGGSSRAPDCPVGANWAC